MESKYYYIGAGALGLISYLFYRNKKQRDLEEKKLKSQQVSLIKQNPVAKDLGIKSEKEIISVHDQNVSSAQKLTPYKPSSDIPKEEKMVVTPFTQIDPNGVEWVKTLSSPLYGEKTYFWSAMTDGYVPVGGEFQSLDGTSDIADKAIREMRIAIEERAKELTEELALKELSQTFD